MIQSIDDKIFLIKEYLGKDSCEFLTTCFKERIIETPRHGIWGGPTFSKDRPEKGLSSKNDMFPYDKFKDFNIGLDLMTGLGYRMQKTISDHYEKEYYVKSMMFSKMTQGSKNNLHMDNWYQSRDGKIKPRPYNKLDRSALLYLNNDYEGGELYFPRQKWLYKPQLGDFLFFEGNFQNPHEVRMVTSGERYNIISFYSDASAFTIDTAPNEDLFNIPEDQCRLEVMEDEDNIVWEYDDYGVK